ncbi:MAG: GtrA family protein [Sphingobacterium sp.]|nr:MULTISPECIES: GtrA family protein [unclassified Sphingobacterium]WET69860.1 MAG: GtrA family protein [Sphingobacterium sp.]
MLGRYLFSNLGSLLINYLLLKLFVEQFLWYPTPSQILCTFIVTVYSFLMQKKFTFSLSLKEPN